jgi:hypothetical protein
MKDNLVFSPGLACCPCLPDSNMNELMIRNPYLPIWYLKVETRSCSIFQKFDYLRICHFRLHWLYSLTLQCCFNSIFPNMEIVHLQQTKTIFIRAKSVRLKKVFGIIFLSPYWVTYFSTRRGCPRVWKFCKGCHKKIRLGGKQIKETQQVAIF